MNQLHRKSGLITPITNPPEDDKITPNNQGHFIILHKKKQGG